MQEAKHEGDANYWKPRYVLLEGKHKHLKASRDELLEALTILVHQVKQDLGMFPGQPHKESALGIAEAAIAKATARGAV